MVSAALPLVVGPLAGFTDAAAAAPLLISPVLRAERADVRSNKRIGTLGAYLQLPGVLEIFRGALWWRWSCLKKI